jgi:hypothetical protein
MARRGYGSDYGRGYDRHSFGGQIGYQMDPGWGWDDTRDPNWRGGTYHGMRMHGDPRHAAYGSERFFSQHDLGGYGGFDGRYDLPDGWFDREGYYHEQWEGRGGPPPPRYVPAPHDDLGIRRVDDGGVRYGRDYLRQYNAYSPALRRNGPERDWRFGRHPADRDRW